MNLDDDTLQLLRTSVAHLEKGFSALPDARHSHDHDRMQQVLQLAAERLQNNYPYYHPFYMGQMLKPPHPVAQLAYALAMNINPNNHALDGGRASSVMEKEAVASIAAMFGWQEHLGHLCGGGTMANFEALWVARELATDPHKRTILASSQSHYTHSRFAPILNVPYRSVAVDDRGAMSIAALERELQHNDVGTVVVTLGTTLSGAVDPLPQILALAKRFHFRVHVDTAYGGYFTLAHNLDPDVRMAFDAISAADSVVIDPHKHGLQPYGCGCVLFRDTQVGRVYQHDSPYTYFSSDDLHLGEISLECSRPGAAAVALWTTLQMLPLGTDGEFAANLSQCRQAAMSFYHWLHEAPGFTPLFGPQLDIVCWASTATSASATSARTRRLFEIAAGLNLHLAIAKVPRNMCVALQGITQWDQNHVDCLRACVMKPEHLEWLPQITVLLAKARTALEAG